MSEDIIMSNCIKCGILKINRFSNNQNKDKIITNLDIICRKCFILVKEDLSKISKDYNKLEKLKKIILENKIEKNKKIIIEQKIKLENKIKVIKKKNQVYLDVLSEKYKKIIKNYKDKLKQEDKEKIYQNKLEQKDYLKNNNSNINNSLLKNFEIELKLHKNFLNEKNILNNFEMWKNLNIFQYDNDYNLIVDIVVSNLQLSRNRILGIYVCYTKYNIIYPFEGANEFKIIKDFINFLNSLPKYKIFVYDLDIKRIIGAQEIKYSSIKSPFCENSKKCKGIHDLKIEFDTPASEFNSKLQEMINSLDLVPLDNISENSSEEERFGDEIAAKWKQIQNKKKYQIENTKQIKEIYNVNKKNERDQIFQARIKIIYNIYNNMRWIKDG